MRKPKYARRGFTLVEVIVVLVILAILAAIMIPAMTGWIDKARERRLVVGCRTCVTAAQTVASEKYGALGAGNVGVTPEETLALAQVRGSVFGIVLDGATAAVDMLSYADPRGDMITYYRMPTPHYEFGGGNMYGSVVAISEAFKKATTKGPNGIQNEAGETFGGGKIDGVNYQDPTSFAYAMYQTFSPQLKEYLNTVSWSIVRDGGSGSPYYLYVTPDSHYSATDSASNIKVYKYDMTSKTYQYTSDGTKVDKGMVTSNGTSWSAPSLTMD